MSTRDRKTDHIFIVLTEDVEEKDPLFSKVHLIHQSTPEVNFNSIDTSIDFLGYKLSMPLIITGMTGGNEIGEHFNKILALAAEKHKIAIGVGSQRVAIENSSVKRSFRVVREEAENVPVIANIGAQQLKKSSDPLETARMVVEMIEADALAIHLNPAQEIFQVGGDIDYTGVLKAIEKVVVKLEVPVIVKETGAGLSKECVASLWSKGVKYFDVAGAGGTSWVKVEAIRAKIYGEKELYEAGTTFRGWGIPTVISIIEARTAAPESFIIASGGVRSGLDIAKSIAVGADMAGIALPALKAASKGVKELNSFINKLKIEFKASLFLTGCRRASELRTKPVVLEYEVVNWIKQRGIDLIDYMNRIRMQSFTRR